MDQSKPNPAHKIRLKPPGVTALWVLSTLFTLGWAAMPMGHFTPNAINGDLLLIHLAFSLPVGFCCHVYRKRGLRGKCLYLCMCHLALMPLGAYLYFAAINGPFAMLTLFLSLISGVFCALWGMEYSTLASWLWAPYLGYLCYLQMGLYTYVMLC